jgi:predicted transcriptional regulator
MKARISVTIPEDLQIELDRFATETKRTTSAVVEMALEQLLAREAIVKQYNLGAVKADGIPCGQSIE